ncbi:hypothetical protein [Mycolicibacterium fortuitum]|uniref:hypothetical protein n=1 Tax=Mycolicibacterium fortuitum TaxID=1766 RepID=UPI0026141A1A|nr:hypothetical protein [Mycolicibacterium fortuitum]
MYIDVVALFEGDGRGFPDAEEWDKADAILAEHGIGLLDRRNHRNAPTEAGYPGNRAYLRSQMRRRLVKAGHIVSYADGEGGATC